MNPDGRPTDVTIFGKTYTLRGVHSPEQIKRLARLVDAKMREIASDPRRADALKVAVLAAINFAEELERYRKCFEEREQQIGTASARLNAVLADCLEGAEGTEGGAGRSLDSPVHSQ